MLEMPRRINPYKAFTILGIPNWLARRDTNDVSQGAKMAYGRLCQYAGKKGVAWPRQQILADEIGVTRGMVCRYLKQLRDLGLIEIVEVEGERGWSKYYFLDHEWIVYKDDVGKGSTIQDMSDEAEEEIESLEVQEGLQELQEVSVYNGKHPVHNGKHPVHHGKHPVHNGVQGCTQWCTQEENQEESQKENQEEVTMTNAANADSSSHPDVSQALTLDQDFSEKKLPGRSTPPWLDKEQPGRRSVTYPVPMASSGPEARLATLTQAADTARQRADKHKAEKVLRKHKAEKNLKGDAWDKNPSIRKGQKYLESCWCSKMIAAFPEDTQPPWDGKARGQMQRLLKTYRPDEVEKAMDYLISNWAALNIRMFKGDAVFPTLDMLTKLVRQLIMESSRWLKVKDVMEEYEAWNEQNPNKLYPPEDLEVRYTKAKGDMEALGLLPKKTTSGKK